MAEKGVVGNTDYDSRVYIPITVVFKKFTNARFGGDSVRMVYVSAESKEAMDERDGPVERRVLIRQHDVDPASPGFS